MRGREVLSSIVSSQNELHARFGGVVPEVASRRHTELVNEVVAEAMSQAGAGWDDLGAVAVTQGPGLIGALLVGLATGKSLAYRRGLPLIPVNHLQGHIAANYALGVEAPFVCLVASGGHTLLAVVEEGVSYRVAAKTMDDAAGEAFDKGARLLGLGYPGGKELDELAAHGDPGFARFPRAVPRGRGFSFSGLKTALLYDLRGREAAEVAAHRADIAASYQAAIVRHLNPVHAAGGNQQIRVMDGCLACHGQVSPALADYLIDQRHAYPNVAKAARGQKIAVMYKLGNGLCSCHALVAQLARFVVPDPLAVFVWIMPA
ncbi:tRNA (adenosine(37)-N6)-threonylcarbamoyltransferase complex transferase subunit TsaD, partial [bacterium]|nr:tRNA (adenosine(37)-N6)-threonylcarbamoyltransferase complex transferase subunit TsaD [bacterium]